MADMTDKPQDPDDDDPRVGINFNTQNLRCLIVLNDRLARVLSDKAGNAYFRAFVVEDRKTGEVFCKQRFRYVDSDAWSQMRLGAGKEHFTLGERVEYFANGVEKVLRTGLAMMAGGNEAPEEAVVRFYPPKPEDHEATMDWLFAQDLIEATKIVTPDGHEVPVSSQQGNA
jgi:hypothetical protein